MPRLLRASRRAWIVVLLLCTAFAAPAQRNVYTTATKGHPAIAIINVNLIDVNTGAILPRHTVVIRDGRIVGVARVGLLNLTRNRPLLVKQSISSLEKLLSPHRFIRDHRSYMVALEKVSSYTTIQVRIGVHSIPIGRLYKNKVEEFLKP